MSHLGFNNPLHPPEILGQRLMLKVRSPLVQTSQLMLPQTVEQSDNFYAFTENSSRSEPAQKPIYTINRLSTDDSELESTSEANINRNTSKNPAKPQIHHSTAENLQNNPLSELHSRLGEQLIQTQSRILTTASDQILSSQTPEPSESQSIKNQSDNLPVIQAKWESDISQRISDEPTQPSLQIIQPQSLIQKQSLDSVAESSLVEPPEISHQIVEPNSLIQEKSLDSTEKSLSQTIQPQSLIQKQSLDSTEKSSSVEPTQPSLESTSISSPSTIQPQSLIQEQSLNSVAESSSQTIEYPQSSSPTIEPNSLIQEQYLDSVEEPSSPTIEFQSLIQEQSLNSVEESSSFKFPEITNKVFESNSIIPANETQSYIIQKQAKYTEDLSSPQLNVSDPVNQQKQDNQSLIIQSSLNPEKLTNQNLIQCHSPLIQKSDFIQSQLINEFIETTQTSQASPEITSIQNRQTPETWSSQFDLMSENIPLTENEPESWSNLTELMNYDNFNSLSNSELTSDHSKSITRDKKQSILDDSVSVSSFQTEANKAITASGDSVLIDEEQLEIIARKVYVLLRQNLEIERESHHFKIDGALPWLDTISSTSPEKASGFSQNSSSVRQMKSQTGSSISLVNYNLQRLTRKVYQVLQLKIETERERLGFYYRGNIPW